MTGAQAEEILRHELKIQCELSDAANVLFLLTFADDESTVTKLVDALKLLPARESIKISSTNLPREISRAKLSPRETFYAPTISVKLRDAIGKICAEEVTFYPPGIPLLMPGEEISAQVVEQIEREKLSGGKIFGVEDSTLNTIKIVC